MAINSSSNIKNIVASISSSVKDAGAEIAKIYGGHGQKTPPGQVISAEKHELNAERKAKKIDSKERDAVNTDEISIPKSSEPLESLPTTKVPQPAVKSETMEDLARLYVKQYEDKSGNKLSDKDFEAKVLEVSQFYGEIQNGKERLDSVVFANDKEIALA